MNLIVATRIEPQHLRLEVEGKWRGDDALQLAYLVKAAGLRSGRNRVLIDLRRVRPAGQSQGPFAICDTLRRALAAEARVALVLQEEGTADETVVSTAASTGVTIATFLKEGPALQWLHAI